ncbi:hypothetical protein ACFQZU_06200 [Streptomonospora algeriensis]|uniref:Uncharacterized protein n=1 Tax=Streptomonospora algeriensis TaxID=995084 RepID=A0ABW3BDT1_9ACTN
MSSGQTAPDATTFSALLTCAGRRVLAAAESAPADPLKAATGLRREAELALADAAGGKGGDGAPEVAPDNALF